MSVNISIQHAVKRYGTKTVIPDLSIQIHSGEFFTLLGPSGCGKTTLLRMIAGFNSIEGGSFYFNDKLINDMDPGKRNIGMVFQNYAIFPHMNVQNNVAFGLKNKKEDKETIRVQTAEFLKIVHMEDYADKKPDQLSGGQQQRVALARALVVRPDVLLMDEPLSNLDAKLRVDMRAVIKQLQHDAGITTVYVTHDQEEAMAISDRIAVMNKGIIQQVGRPQAIYQRPFNLFVASFIGKSNTMEAMLDANEAECTVTFANGYKVMLPNIRKECRDSRMVKVAIRPEEFIITPPGTNEVCDGRESGIRATIIDSVFLGLNTHYFVELDTGEKAEVVQESQVESILDPGQEILLTINTRKINVYDADKEESIMEGVSSGLD